MELCRLAALLTSITVVSSSNSTFTTTAFVGDLERKRVLFAVTTCMYAIAILIIVMFHCFPKIADKMSCCSLNIGGRSDRRSCTMITLILMAFTLRFFWCLMQALYKVNELSSPMVLLLFIINRLCILLLITAMGLVIIGWQAFWALTKGRRPIRMRSVGIIALILYGSQLVVIIVASLETEGKIASENTQSPWFLVDMLLLALTSFFLSIVFYIYGHGYKRRMMRAVNSDMQMNLTRSALNNSMRSKTPDYARQRIIILCMICFGLRSFCFMFGTFFFSFHYWQDSIVCQYIDLITFPIIYYPLPDIIPGFCLLRIIAPNIEDEPKESDETDSARPGSFYDDMTRDFDDHDYFATVLEQTEHTESVMMSSPVSASSRHGSPSMYDSSP